VLSVFLDGSGKTDGKHSMLTLACIAVSELVRPEFEAGWQEAVRRLGLASWHTTDAKRRWRSEPSVFVKAVDSLFRALEPFRDKRLWTHSATVVLSDYARASGEISLRAPEALCVDGSVGSLGYKDEKDLPIVLYFDRGEEFRKHIQVVWNKARPQKREWRYRRPRGWPWQIDAIQALDSHSSCGIQAADLLAWIVNRHQTLSRDSVAPESERAVAERWAISTNLFFKHVHKLFDHAYLLKRYSPSIRA
jgi:hypothetical protein